MSDETEGALQFEKAEFGTAATGTPCTVCKTAITSDYFQVNGQVVCPPCRKSIELSMTGGSGSARYVRALAFAVAAGVAGWVVYYAVLALFSLQVGLIAILVGYMVGFAVKKGCGSRGGWVYQTMAVLITYISIAASYIPSIMQEVEEITLLGAIIIAPLVPFLTLPDNLIGLLIIAFGLYQAWVMNRKPALAFTGPFTVTAGVSTPST